MSLIYKARNAIEQIVVSPRVTRFRPGQRFVISRSSVRIRRVAPRKLIKSRCLWLRAEPLFGHFISCHHCVTIRCEFGS